MSGDDLRYIYNVQKSMPRCHNMLEQLVYMNDIDTYIKIRWLQIQGISGRHNIEAI